MTFSTLMWKRKTKIIDCVISGAAHKGMTPIKAIPHSAATHHPFNVAPNRLGIVKSVAGEDNSSSILGFFLHLLSH